MIFPSTNQMTGQTGIPVRHNYNDYYSQMAAQLPARQQVANQNAYYNDMLDVEQKNQQATEENYDKTHALNEEYYDNMYALDKEQAEAAEDARKKGLWFQGAGLGIAGANALNQYTDGGVEKAGRAALDMVMPSSVQSFSPAITQSFSPGEIMSPQFAGTSTPSSDSFWSSAADGIGTASGEVWDSVSGGVGEAAGAVKDFANDYIYEPVKSGASALSKMFTDVTGYVGDAIGSLW